MAPTGPAERGARPRTSMNAVPADRCHAEQRRSSRGSPSSGQPAPNAAVANAQPAGGHADQAQQTSGCEVEIGEATPHDPADDSADIRHRQHEARGHEREAERFRQVDDEKAHEADLQRRVDERDHHELDAAAACERARAAARGRRRATASARASGPHRATARDELAAKATATPAAAISANAACQPNAQREDRQHGARERGAGRHAGLLDRERQRHPRRMRGPREDAATTPA